MRDAPTLGRVVGTWKVLVTVVWRHYHQAANKPCLCHLWQRDYYEHVIRNDEDLSRTREYIVNNPHKAVLLQEQRYEEMKRAVGRGKGGP